MSHEKFFERWGKYQVRAAYYECGADFTVEDLYQVFKERIIAEVRAVRPVGADTIEEFTLRDGINQGDEHG